MGSPYGSQPVNAKRGAVSDTQPSGVGTWSPVCLRGPRDAGFGPSLVVFWGTGLHEGSSLLPSLRGPDLRAPTVGPVSAVGVDLPQPSLT